MICFAWPASSVQSHVSVSHRVPFTNAWPELSSGTQVYFTGQLTVVRSPVGGTRPRHRSRLFKPCHALLRGGDKLAAALDAFKPTICDLICLDIGASTGGFTDCLLQAGAKRVYAVDVGYGQLDWRLRNDDRVVVYERTNARYLQPQDLPERAHVLTIDVSFISLRLLLPTLVNLLEPHAEVITLIKPQFEVGKGQVGKGGVVRDPKLHYQALLDVLTAAQACGLGVRGGIVSPLLGPKGNREFLAHYGLGATARAPDALQALCHELALTTA